jgi:PAS domain S-box-containing protein
MAIMFPFEIAARGSFKRQIILTFVVGFVALVTALAIYMVNSERENLYRDSRHVATGLAHSLAVSSLAWVLANDVVGLQEVVHSFQDYPELRYVMVISPSGRVLAHSDATKVGQFLADESSLALLKSPAVKRVMIDDERLIDVVLPIEVDKRHVGWARVGLGREGIATSLRAMVLNYTLFVLLSLALSFLAAIVVASRLVHRITSLVTVAEDVRNGNFAMRVAPLPGDDEINKLAVSLNLMLDTLVTNEERLRAASLYTRTLIEASLDPLVTISAEGKITDVNRATEEVTGRTREELIGTDFSEYFTEPERARQGYQQVFLHGAVTNYPLALRHRDGRVFDVLYNASLYRNEAGQVLGVFAAARDMTGQKRAEAARMQLAAIVESSSDAIIGKTPEGIITSWNNGAERIYGFAAEDVIGKPITILAPPSRHAEIEGILEKIRRGECVANYESERIRKDGELIQVALTLSPIRDVAGNLVGISTIARDITERKLAEKALAAVTRALRMLSDANQILIHASDEAALLSEVCRIAVDVGGYQMAWVAYAEHDEGKSMRPVAHAGIESGYIMSAQLSWGDNERGQGPGGVAIRTRQPSVVRNIENDPAFAPWREAALQRGYKSLIALPLICDGEVLGAIGIYSGEADVFATKEVEVLKRLASDLALGVGSLRVRIKRMQAEAALKQSEEKYRTLIHKIQVAVVVHAADTQILISNSMAQELLGLSEDQLLGKTAVDPAWHFLREDGTAAAIDEYPVRQVLDSRKAIRNLVLGVHRPDRGGDVWVLVNADPVLGNNGEISQIIVSFIDITERKLAEVNLMRMNERFSLASRAADLGVWDWDIRKDELLWDGRMYALYGIKREDFSGAYQAWLQGVHPDDRVRSDEAIQLALSGKREFDTEFRVVWPDGSIHFLKAYGRIVRDAEGNPQRMTGINFDITERKLAEEALRREQALLSRIMVTSPVGIAVVSKTGQVTFANPQAEKILGLSKEEITQRSYNAPEWRTTAIDGGPFHDEEQPFSRVMATRQPVFDVQHAIVWPDGHRVLLSINGAPIFDALGEIEGVVFAIEDITLRKLAEEELRASERRYRLAQTIGHVGNWEYNIQTEEFWGSDEAKRIYGLNPAQPGFSVDDIEKCIPERERVHQALIDLIEKDKPYDLEFEIYPKGSSEIRIISSVADLQRDQNGRPQVVMGVIQDITERKRTMEALRRSEHGLSEAQRIAHLGNWELDLSTNELIWSNEIFRIFEIDREKFGASRDAFLKACHPDDREMVNKAYTDSQNDRVPYDIVHRLLMPDGRIKYVNERCETYYGADGKPLRLVGTVHDITEHKKTEAALRESEWRHREILDNVLDAVYLLEVTGDGRFRTIEVNPALERLTGVPREQSVGKTQEEAVPEDVARIVNAKYRHCVEAGYPVEEEVELELPSGKRYFHSTMIPARNEKGEVYRIVGISRDVTERKKAEEEIKALNRDLEQRVIARTADLDAANKELEAFSFSVSHDLRTPLRAIDGFSQILLEDYEDKLDAEGKRLLNVVRDNTHRMGALIDDILKFSRAGRTELSFVEIDMEALAGEVYAELQSALVTGNLQLEIEAIPSAQGDRAMMRQVFANLLSNAIKFSRTRETPRIKVGFFIEGGEVVYYVRDNGVGFDMQYAGKLFGVFQRLHGVDEFEGTGIGLAIVKRVITRHGGRVWAEGKVGAGATVYFSLPHAEPNERP